MSATTMLASPNRISAIAEPEVSAAEPPVRICCSPELAQLSGRYGLIAPKIGESACVGSTAPEAANCSASTNTEAMSPARPKPATSAAWKAVKTTARSNR